MMYSREVARRVFLEELRKSDLSFREGDDSQYAPQYLLTPTGARCNRVFVVGTLIERDDIGEEVEYWRGRLADPTGSILIYAGQYQPEAARALAEIEIPAFVAVVGKPSVYETEDGKKITSIRAEAIQKVDLDTRNKWLIEAARRTLERLELMRSIDVPESTDFQPGTVYHPEVATVEDCRRAIVHYSTNIEEFKQMVITALRAIRNEQPIESLAEAHVGPEVRVEASSPGVGMQDHSVPGKLPLDYEGTETKYQESDAYTKPQPGRRRQTGSKRISSLIDLENDDIEEIDL